MSVQVRDRRGISQVVFNHLPDQTVDLRGRIWRVTRWADARAISVDVEVVRREVLKGIYPWSSAGLDNGLAESLRKGAEIFVVTPSEDSAVLLEPFPELFRCKTCQRIADSPAGKCRCGEKRWGQLSFVAYHKCGRLDTPWVAKCKEHGEVRLELPQGRSIREVRHVCPVDHKEIAKGFPQPKCECGMGPMQVNVHRLSAVYTPRIAVIVNPPGEAIAAQLRGPAAARRVLGWVLNGMSELTALTGKPTLESLVQTFIEQGIDQAAAREMAAAAAEKAGGAMASEEKKAEFDLEPDALEAAEEDALKLAYATASKRTRLDELVESAEPVQKAKYELRYRPAIGEAACDGVDLLEDFPVLTACYGYTRAEHEAGATSLRWFQTGNRQLRIHGQLSRTEALLFRLNPLLVARWLQKRGHLDRVDDDPRAARLRILKGAEFPQPGEELAGATLGSDLLTLVHSLSHRVIRQIASLAGIDQDSIAELLVPRHLGLIVYATTRGDFVLGGLQAMFEHDLHHALKAVVHGESRCALDPACSRDGGACVACLHVGEPSCRYFNQYLGRDTLFGPDGLFALAVK